MKFEENDIIITKKREKKARDYEAVYVDDMLVYGGKAGTIISCSEYYYAISVDCGSFCWSDDMLIKPVQLS